ncbi:cytochrome P450 [Clohesyomyces aquaticus]|uniref:Cytochrome P450 n=1 Tax=Clohesyomyces aquaticus TaxID=1231657 RepID=A0A1Y1ZEW4_9PLEO|nr:cytochrome P450 [Clohesyomyces aquaticus]
MPRYNAVFGHMLVLRQQMNDLPADCTTNHFFLKTTEEFPNGLFYFDLWPFTKPLLVVNSPTAANQLAHAGLDKPEEINLAMHNLTDGPNLFIMEEQPWKVWRPLFTPGFTIVLEVNVFCDLLRGQARHGTMFQLENLTIRLTIDVIGAVSVDSRWNYQVRDHPLASALRTQIEWTEFGSEMSPWYRYHPMHPLILWYNNRRLAKLVDAEILKRYNELRASSAGRKGDASVKDSKHDTTSSALIYCYHGLTVKPEAMEKLRAEDDEVFGDVATTVATISDRPHLLNQLPYTLVVIKESLRLFPPASSMRMGKPGINIVDEEGTSFPTESCYYWKDPDSFIPERWLVGPEDPLYPPKGAWRPFEFGPRSCLGQTLALVELKTVLWDQKHRISGTRIAVGTRAYWVEGGGGGAYPAERYPCTVTLRE